MDFQYLTLLSEGQIWGNDSEPQLDVFKKIGPQALNTDLCILKGAHFSYNFKYGFYYTESGHYWTKSSSDGKDAYVVSGDGEKKTSLGSSCCYGIRPVLQSPEIFAQLSQNRVKGDSGVDEVDFGEYPQTVANGLEAILESKYKIRGELIETGNTYTFKCDDYANYTAIEYEYQGKKYIRTRASYYFDRDFALSNNRLYQSGDVIWLEVLPVRWLIDDRTKILISKRCLLSGVELIKAEKYASVTYDGDFSKTTMCAFLNGIMFKDLIQNLTQIRKKSANFIKNSFDLKYENVELLEIIKASIANDIAVFLHGDTVIVRFDYLKRIYPNSEMIYLPNATLEKLNGKNVFDESKGKMVDLEPIWFKKLQEKCEKEKDKFHVILFDEITSAPLNIQSAVFNMILNKEVNELWKLPKNARIVLATTDKEDSLVSNRLVKLFSDKFAHFYIQTSFDYWQYWARKNNMHPFIYSYIAYRGNEILCDKYDGKNPNADPERWKMASKMLYTTRNPSILKAVVGEKIADDFTTFCHQQVITLDNVINEDYTKNDIQKLNPAQKYAITAGVVRTNEIDYNKVKEFVAKLGTEYLKIFEDLWMEVNSNNLETQKRGSTNIVLGRSLKK